MIDVKSVRALYSSPSIRNLCRPIRTRDSWHSHETYGKELEALAFAIRHGDCGTKAAAEMVAYRLLYEAIAARLLERDRGPIPRMVEQIRHSIKLFEEILR